VRNALRKGLAHVPVALPAARAAYRWQEERVAAPLVAAVRDRRNQARFGLDAPRLGEMLWVDPSEVRHYALLGGALSGSARVHAATWPPGRLQPIDDDPVMRTSVARWVHDLPWEDTGEVERMERAIARKGPLKGCRTRADILRRCERLDEIYRTVERDGRLRPHAEMEPGGLRELGGIGMHIGPDGTPVRAENGRHRFAIGRILQLPKIPVRVGVVHRSDLPLLAALRRA